MHPGRLLRSSPFRLAIAFGLLFVAAFLVSVTVAYQSVKADLSDRLDRTVEETYSVIVASYGGSDIEDLIASVETQSRVAETEERVITLIGPNGGRVAGTATATIPPPGWSTITPAALGVGGGALYRVYSGTFDGNRLVVAMSYAETDELLGIALTSFGWGFLFIVACMIAGGILLALRVQRRMDAIAGTMTQVSHGDLGSRIPLIGNGDDIDTLSVQINAALDRLAALVEGMRQVSADIAHDLKTPLNRLKLIVEAAIDKQDKGISVAAELVDARAESDQINATFDALLRIAQIESGARKSRFVRLDLDGILAAMAEVYAEVAADEGLALDYCNDNAGAWILGDRELLLQLFSNLVENALRHCPEGTVIRLGLERAAGSVVATVRDDGPGIPEGERDNVLQRLYRLDKSRTTPGTGLGLSLVKAIADLHGASLQLADARPGLEVALGFPGVSSEGPTRLSGRNDTQFQRDKATS